MHGLSITVTDDTTPRLHKVAGALRRPDMRMVMGRAVATHLRRHFSQLDRNRENGMRGKRTHFYGQVRDAVQQPQLAGGEGVKVSINHIGIAQRYFGGTIAPVSANWLTIPARAEAYGRRAREFSNLAFVRFRADLAGLVQVGGGDKEGGGLFYWLVKRVTQQPDSTVLPSDQEIRDAAVAAAHEYATIQLKREGLS